MPADEIISRAISFMKMYEGGRLADSTDGGLGSLGPHFRTCTRARKFHAEALFDEIIEIANRPKMGGVVKTDSRGRKERRTGDMVQRAALQIDARKWVLSKLRPKKYGELRVEDSSGDNVAALIQAMHSRYNQIQEEKKLAAPDKALSAGPTTVKKPSSFRASVGPLFIGFQPTENVG